MDATNSQKGKKEHQKLKTYLVLQYLLKNSDELHPIGMKDIIDYLSENGIDAERRSIYRDISEINIVNRMLLDDCSYEEAEEVLNEDSEDDSLKLVRLVGHGRGSRFYAKPDYELNDIRLLIECVYSAKFISEKESKRLADIVAGLVSEPQKRDIEHDVVLTDRIKTDNKNVFLALTTLSLAMSNVIVEVDNEDRETHSRKPAEKISFVYQKKTINELKGSVAKKNEARVVVSPYKLLINDGNYYLLAFNNKYQKIMTYRVDKMRSVQRVIGVPRDGEDEFAKLDLKSYLQSTFSMFDGEMRLITLRFINPLLDVAFEKFGDKGATYTAVDDNHFQVITHVQISNPFFSWLAGFGDKVKIIDPPDIAEKYRNFLKHIFEMYES